MSAAFDESDLRRHTGVVVEGDTPMPPANEAAGSVLLLPYFDAYVVGSHPRDPLFPGQATSRARAPSGQAGNYPVLIIDGVVAGVWHHVVPGSGSM